MLHILYNPSSNCGKNFEETLVKAKEYFKNEEVVSENILEIEPSMIKKYGAVSVPVAASMALNARLMMDADIGLSVTGLAGPGGDEYGNPVGTVCIGYSSHVRSFTKQFRFSGDREEVRQHAINAALTIVLEMLSE